VEEVHLLIIFTNLHHKLSLLIIEFKLFLSRSLPALDPSCYFFFLRLLLLFFQKNQILTPDIFKAKLHSDLLRKKRNFEEFRNSKEVSSSSGWENRHNMSFENPKRFLQKKTLSKPDNETSACKPKKRLKHCDIAQNSENIFCFIRKFMRNSAIEILNLTEVSNQFVEKLSEMEFNGNGNYFCKF
jgi:hypothetical protein